VAVSIDADERVIWRRLGVGFCDVVAPSLDEAIAMAEEAKQDERPLGIAVLGNAAELFPAALQSGWRPDIVTEMCPCHDPLSYIPAGYTPDEAEALRRADRILYLAKARDSMVRQLDAMIEFSERGAQVFEYGTSIRKECRDAGMPEERAMQIPGFVAAYIRPLFELGRGPFRWTCLSGEATDLAVLDDLVLELFGHDQLTAKWIGLARQHLPIEGLPARVCYLGFGERKAFGLRVNELVRNGTLAGPVAFSRDNLDSGSIVNPTFESEKMKDGSDLISDWPYLNALLNTAAMADLVAIQANYAMGEAVHTGVTMIADGSEEADLRLEACLTTDSGIGVVRHAQAGYAAARATAEGNGPLTEESIDVPLWWTPEATFGPEDSSSDRLGPHTRVTDD